MLAYQSIILGSPEECIINVDIPQQLKTVRRLLGGSVSTSGCVIGVPDG